MSFIPKPLRVCDRELAHVDTLGFLIGLFRNKWRSDSRTFFPKLFGQGNVMPTPVIPRWARNRSCFIWVKSKPLRTGSNYVSHPLGLRRGWLGGSIKRKAKRFSERGECAFSSVCFRRL